MTTQLQFLHRMSIVGSVVDYSFHFYYHGLEASHGSMSLTNTLFNVDLERPVRCSQKPPNQFGN